MTGILKMKIRLPDKNGRLYAHRLVGTRIDATPLTESSSRIIYSAAHVVSDPLSDSDPHGPAAIDWEATLAFRIHLADLGLGIAEAMDTAQRGMGLDWSGAYELIRRTREALPDARVANGAGTDHLHPRDARSLDDVRKAYFKQLDAVQKLDARVILMASRALARVASGPDDYFAIYSEMLEACEHPVILHWLGDMFDPALAGYWGVKEFGGAMEVLLDIIAANEKKIDGIKISLLDKDKEIGMRRRLPGSVKMYTGDDFNYPELIAGDQIGYSHALLGIFDPLAAAAAQAVTRLTEGDVAGFHAVLDPTVPLARHIFRAPTQYYKTGVVFLAWLNGFQNHFAMLNGAQASRSLPHLAEIFKMSDECGLLRQPDLAVERMRSLLKIYGVE